MCGYVFRDLSSAVAVKDSIEGHIGETRNLIVGDVGVLHIFTPSLHLAGCVFVIAILLPVLFFGGDRFIQKTIAHYYITLIQIFKSLILNRY